MRAFVFVCICVNVYMCVCVRAYVCACVSVYRCLGVYMCWMTSKRLDLNPHFFTVRQITQKSSSDVFSDNVARDLDLRLDIEDSNEDHLRNSNVIRSFLQTVTDRVSITTANMY